MKKVTTLLIDDIDGSEAQHTIAFAVDGTQYEIDLNEENLARLNEAFQPYLEAGRRIRGAASVTALPTQRSGGRSRARKDREQTQAMRDWGRANGFTVPERGRIPAALQEAYNNRPQ